MALNKNDIDNIATISRIEINDKQSNIFLEELNSTFKVIQRIQDIELANIEPLINPISLFDGTESNLREDKEVQNQSHEFINTIKKNSPKFEENLFIVPKIVEQP
ncbi:aspartyl-tRNA(Asn)/glutamyl-tRNA (Gln) amidotransferase subunit C [Candidatus Kinetoplastibacterium desouzaii TCC079E]|uniref:Glutamyl-tRNA(Gln) amidotransferase subunit C n=1 Tax=Candidatus Kinetoplastidibacterium desouzai TCC079E TaxID=1208919 RepID=M1LSZ2_9PROT|nr:Asp-tRNA(Asn)/Glu-tRNA(Gln) amidotransferase subunit GatC [Candidatus Kinetoplastibacterium desouzaii]AGF47216.1 aspartyl-tRNA(Asn)/glutamyl-tRNA (Gln) amidotransferase subunit C [Candidatus Kinetoplastibacterium desouzaii TCC079E]